MGNSYYIDEEVIANLKEDYLEARKLLDEDSKNDLETEPYKSKYAAMKKFKNMQNLLSNFVDNAQQETEVTAMLAVVYLNEGIIATDTEELKSGQDYLMNCINVLSKTEINAKSILPMLSALNQLGILWSKLDDTSKAKEYLERAEKQFKDYKSLKIKESPPVNMSTLFGIDDSNEPLATEIMEKLYTLTLYYLAQIYGNLGDLIKSSVYCHMTLRRQLEMNDFDSIDWALNCATLSQFFMEKEGFQQARHHLAAATHIVGKYEDTLKEMSSKELHNENEKEILDSKWENFRHRSADISRCWAKYGILLLSSSRDRLIEKNENVNDKFMPDSANMQADPKSDITQECLNNLKFYSIKNDIAHIANNIIDKYLLDFNDAKAVFLNVQKWLDDAKTFYTLENHASDYIQIIQDTSQLYKYLSFFEEDEDRQAKMHKRRIDLLESTIKELNERYYLNACRQIWMELGETYSEILDIKLDRLKDSDERPTPHILSKINHLAKSSIHNFDKFVESVKKDTKNDKFTDDLVRPTLCAYFHLGRLYNKFITPDKKLQVDNLKKSLDAYSYLVNYCEKDQKTAALMSEELNICKDFVKLLPVKMNKLTYEISRAS
ncbi:KIF-binding protein [Phymastichus coffea]|uniref:KIF-binding protein n=1 Tax=Phymastichus coffea TaxID=108790 RepID=UPI00273B664A|nr:KIF-binding protein [Phymastichus coffea]